MMKSGNGQKVTFLPRCGNFGICCNSHLDPIQTGAQGWKVTALTDRS